MTFVYTLLFSLLGLIDQRRGSAIGEIQMIFSNCTGLVVACMLLPSLQLDKFKKRIYKIWTPICMILTAAACVYTWAAVEYPGQRIVTVLTIAVWSYYIVYIIQEWKEIEKAGRLKRPFFWCFVILMLLIQFSKYESTTALWYLLIFGGMYLIGIPERNREKFFQGMLNGMILWFFVQQIIAFGFRPYDYVRYKGLYSGETQNGLFYMFAYCAFLLKWIWLKKRGAKLWWQAICFFLAAGCVSFMLFTGGRAPLVASAVVTLMIYVWYDICCQKSIYRWLKHCLLFGVCLVVTFPLVYGCIRYLPTILHHPVWFEGEYVESTSVRSFDPWDSDRYISFEAALETNIGRILQILGVDMGAAKVQAAELGQPGSSRENPYALPGTDFENSVSIRKSIYAYYIQHLNLMGHEKSQSGFYIDHVTFIDHTHNMFLQTAYDNGILAGVLFLGMYLFGIFDTFRKHWEEKMICLTFLVAILGFGMFEMALIPGQITMNFIWILFCFVGDEKNGKIGDSRR